MRLLFLIAAAVAIALGLGGWTASRALRAGAGSDAVRIGPWTADPLVNSVEASPYEQARLSQTGDLTLGIGEGVQFRTSSDSEGEPLRLECSYRLFGELPLARVWTLAAFLPDGELVQPGEGRPGWLVSRSLLRADDNAVAIAVSPSAQPGNWISVTGRGPFRLVLTLYDTPASSSSGVGRIELPGVERKGCSAV